MGFTGDKQTDAMITIFRIIVFVFLSQNDGTHALTFLTSRKYSKKKLKTDYKEKFKTTDEQFGVKEE